MNTQIEPTQTSIEKKAEVNSSNCSELLFSVSTGKLITLTFCTLGIYYIYWFYKNWVAIAKIEKLDILSFPRALFSIFFCVSLFRRIAITARARGYTGASSEDFMAVLFILFNLVASATSKFDNLLTYIGYAVFYITLVPILEMQDLINFSNLKVNSDYVPQSKFSLLEKFIVFFGGIFFLMTVIGVVVGISENI